MLGLGSLCHRGGATHLQAAVKCVSPSPPPPRDPPDISADLTRSKRINAMPPSLASGSQSCLLAAGSRVDDGVFLFSWEKECLVTGMGRQLSGGPGSFLPDLLPTHTCESGRQRGASGGGRKEVKA